MTVNNYEIETVLQTIDLLKKYDSAKIETKKKEILQKLRNIDIDKEGYLYTLIKKNYYTPKYLITRLEKAIKKDKYRPKNLPIISFALEKDLDYVNGEFDTFDLELSQMSKNEKDHNKIREKFIKATRNINVLAKQFSNDWIRRLKNHKDLVDAAKHATEKNAVNVYQELFDALTKDFCLEYKCKIRTVVVLNWEDCAIRPEKYSDETCGYQATYNNAFFADGLSETQIKKLRKKADAEPEKFKISVVIVNIGNLRKFYSRPQELFYKAIGVFAHEAHHALDFQKSRQGALGQQVYDIDSKTYVLFSEDAKANVASATELSSYKIYEQLIQEMEKSRI